MLSCWRDGLLLGMLVGFSIMDPTGTLTSERFICVESASDVEEV